MEGSTQAAPIATNAIYRWEVPGEPVAVHLTLDVIDSVLPEVMRAFGAVPKRGAEAGGLLIGSIERDSAKATVRVEQIELVPCLYALGPSYLLSSDDKTAFEEAVGRWKPETAGTQYVVGYFRSHTREGLALTSEDIELLDRLFPDPAHVALLVRPFASKPIQARFFFRDNGAFLTETPLAFVFNRRELEAQQVEPPQAPPTTSQLASAEPIMALAPVTEERKQPERSYHGSPRRVIPLPDDFIGEGPAPDRDVPPKPGASGMPAWMWVPLSVALLVIGAVIGIEAPRYFNLTAIAPFIPDFGLGLSVSRTGDSLTVHWNPDAPAIRNAQSGTLEIEDGGYSKPVDLDSAHLQSGSIIYRNIAPSVRFRLVVSQGGRVSVTETTDWPR
jgi:hypothetical protein